MKDEQGRLASTIRIDKEYEPPEWKKPGKKKTKGYSAIAYQNSSLRKRRLKMNEEKT